MSELFLSFLIALGILAAMFAFVPMLHICNARCQRLFLRKPRQQSAKPERSHQTLTDAA